MSSRKIRGLTCTGRQVSEDPDLDNLLSTLSPEEVEELQNDMMKVPDPANEGGQLFVQGERPSGGAPHPANGTAPDSKAGGRPENDPKGRLGPREPSPEGDSRKQEYPRKRGLNQEGNEDKRGGIQRQSSISTERDARLDTTRSGRGGAPKEESLGLSSRYSRRSEVREDTKETCEDSSVQKDRRDARESTGSKTKDMISKLQEKKEKESQEKEKKEDSRRKDDSKTKDIISKLREKSERDGSKEKERKDEIRTRGRVSMLLDKQNKAEESQVDEKKVRDKDQTKVKLERQKTEKDEGDGVQPTAAKAEKRKETDEEVKPNNQAKEEREVKAHKNVEENKSKEGRDEGKNDKRSRANKAEESTTLNNCDTGKSPSGKGEEEEDEDASMFDELMEQVRTNDPSLLELNVNNSEVIKVKTLIQFAEALHKNTHIKTFALANCRADDHVAYAIAGTLRYNTTITSINLDSNLLTGKGIMSIIQALQRNSILTELRFHNQRHICGGKTEMEMTKILKDNTTLLKLGYHFELAGPRMTMTNILSRNMDRQRQKRLQEQKLAQANGEKKGTLEVPKTGGGGGSLRCSPKGSPRPSPIPSPMPSPKLTPKKGGAGSPAPPPPPPPPGGGPPPPPPPALDVDSLRNSLTPVSRRKMDAKGPAGSKNSRDQLLASIRGSGVTQLKKVPVPKWLQ
ncbi:Leiomodin-1 [Merluccius polli]|uniref:Leiomodin-1 n=1 Tax=Merluccius polli TaxID=89951 RepID=A0AA47MIA2_MERPO|nr:Leiomodin-1 [Merluccius polli]